MQSNSKGKLWSRWEIVGCLGGTRLKPCWRMDGNWQFVLKLGTYLPKLSQSWVEVTSVNVLISAMGQKEGEERVAVGITSGKVDSLLRDVSQTGMHFWLYLRYKMKMQWHHWFHLQPVVTKIHQSPKYSGLTQAISWE